jgi:hypothetical protein
MPLPLLMPHLLRKSLIRPRETADSKKFREIQQRVEELLRLTPPAKGEAGQAKSAAGQR